MARTPEEISAAERYDTRLSIYVAPELERQKAAQAHAVSYAQAALNATLLLNGGALIAYPAFIESARLSAIISVSAWNLILPIGFHVLGLILSMVAYICAFFVMTENMRIFEFRERQKTRFLGVMRQSEGNHKADLKQLIFKTLEEQQDETKKRNKHQRLANLLEVIGIFLFCASGICFVLGSLFGLMMISIAGPLHVPDSI